MKTESNGDSGVGSETKDVENLPIVEEMSEPVSMVKPPPLPLKKKCDSCFSYVHSTLEKSQHSSGSCVNLMQINAEHREEIEIENGHDTGGSGDVMDYDNASSDSASSSLSDENQSRKTNRESTESSECIDVDEPLLPSEARRNSEVSDSESSLLCKRNDASSVDMTHVDLTVVVTDGCRQEEISWKRVLEEHKDKRAREAVAALGQQRNYERESLFAPYKDWLLRLSHRRRFEIVIALGLFIWLAFFIVLAIFMNGPSSKPEDSDGNAETDTTQSSVFSLLHKPGAASNWSILDNLTWSESNSSTPHAFLSPSSAAQQTVAETPRSSTFASSFISTLKSNRALATPVATTVPTPVTIVPHSTSAAVPLPRTNSHSVSNAIKNATNQLIASHVTSNVTLRSPLKSSTSVRPLSEVNGDYASDQKPSTVRDDVTSPALSRPSLKALSQSKTTKHPSHPELSSSASSLLRSTATSAEVPGILGELFRHLQGTQATKVNLEQLLQEMEPNYQIGIGRADITGPAADVNMMGYANPSQTVGGIHMRQYARAFVIGQGTSRVLFVNIDACMGSTLLKLEILKKLKTSYGDLYHAGNLCLSGTHTHSAPAGYLQDVLFQITSMGYIPETLDAMVDGIVESIHRAHNNVAPGYIVINKGELLHSNINRSPTAYQNNPESERKRYKYDVDKEMVVLKFLDQNMKGIGMLNWFAVHCTSMNNTNRLISSDNKGYAQLLFEQEMDPGSIAGQSEFVAAFAQSNEGDVSPNINGAHCIDTGLPCNFNHSTCGGKVQNCIATGPGKDMFESTKIIGRNQFEKALDLYNSAAVVLTGPVEAVHQYINMTNKEVAVNSTHTARTCTPAMGFSFAAGTTDGPGAFDFKQGDKTGNAFWRLVRNFLHSPSEEQMECHFPKPILLDTGEMNYPYSWQPEIVDTQLLRIGQLLISAVPGEFTTMSGRRVREAVLQEFTDAFPDEQFESVIAGLSNTYSDYITTFEEYHVQRYEGASTIFGPHTLAAYLQQYKKLASHLAQGTMLTGGAKVHNSLSQLMSFVPGVVMDSSPYGYNFGDALKDAKGSYQVGDIVSVQFVAGNPRNSPTNNMTFLTVERKQEDDTWQVVKTDADWETKYIWERTSTLGNVRGLSEVTVEWDTSAVTSSGRYRIRHFGHYKYLWDRKIYPYSGSSKEFCVNAKDSKT